LSTIVEDSEVFRESPAPPGGAPTDSRGLDPGARLARSPGMLLQFFTALRDAKVPVSLKEYLTLLGALDRGLAEHDVEAFYFLSRAALVKDEAHLDRFDRVFGTVFKGLETLGEAVEPSAIPEEWLRKLAEKYLTEAEKAELKALGWDKLFETLAARNGSAPAGPRPSAPTATIPRASASVRTATATSGR